MWFVGFCFLANQWQATKLEDNPLREGGDAARAAITFSFFSIFTWVRTTSRLWVLPFCECWRLIAHGSEQPFSCKSYLNT